MFPTAPRRPAQLYLFDVLYRGGQLLLGVPYTARRERLEELGLEEGPVRTPTWYPGGATDIWAASAADDLEGVVGELLPWAYHPAISRLIFREVRSSGVFHEPHRNPESGSSSAAANPTGSRLTLAREWPVPPLNT
jgi:hypothetical protein